MMFMENKFMAEENSEVEKIKSQIWVIFDSLRNRDISSEDYYVVLFLLSIYKDGIITSDLISGDDSVKVSLIFKLNSRQDLLIVRYRPLLGSFDQIIMRLSDNCILYLFSALRELDKKVLAENFSHIFDSALFRIAKSQVRNAIDIVQPNELTRFMCDLAALKPTSRVYNPFAGSASF